jgi:damage-control phosphatase, subfamily I
MRTSAECILCLLKRDMEAVPETAGAERKAAYLRRVLSLVADSSPELCTAQLDALIDREHRSAFGERKTKNFAELKRTYNQRMLALEASLQTEIDASADPLACAVKLARVGNYIDFGARHEVNDALLDELIKGANGETLDVCEYRLFQKDMENAKSVAYVTDNAGEIVLDKLLIRLLLKRYANARITLLTRGAPTLNDATADDAAETGLAAMVSVIGNGSALAGTVWTDIDDNARSLLQNADVIVAKGQANFETLSGCGLNVYYLLLCKCDFFVERFRVPRLTGMFVNERRLPFPV